MKKLIFACILGMIFIDLNAQSIEIITALPNSKSKKSLAPFSVQRLLLVLGGDKVKLIELPWPDPAMPENEPRKTTVEIAEGIRPLATRDFESEFMPKTERFLRVKNLGKIHESLVKLEELREALASQIAFQTAETTPLALKGNVAKLSTQLGSINERIETITESIGPQELRNKLIEELEAFFKSAGHLVLYGGDLKAEAIKHAFDLDAVQSDL